LEEPRQARLTFHYSTSYLNAFQCYVDLSIIKEKDKIFNMHAEICLHQSKSSWGMEQKRQKRLVKVEKWYLSRSQAFFYYFC